MAMENGPLEDVFPSENGDIPLLVSLPDGILFKPRSFNPRFHMVSQLIRVSSH